MKKENAKTTMLGMILVVMFLLMAALRPTEFLRVSNFQSMLSQMPEFGIISLGMMLVILTGGINLSIINTGALSSVAGVLLMKHLTESGMHWGASILLGVLLMLVVGLLCGVLNGFMVGYLNLPSILVTLGTMSLFEGIAMNLTEGASITGIPAQFMMVGKGIMLGIPVSTFFYIGVIVVMWFYLNRTAQGMHTYMVGSNKKALEYSGVNPKKVLFTTMVISAMLASVAFIIMASRYNSAKVGYGETYLMRSIAAVVLGGTAIDGGKGKILDVILAVGILQVLATGLNMMLITGHISNVLIGCILIFVLAVDHVLKYLDEQKNIAKMASVKGRIG